MAALSILERELQIFEQDSGFATRLHIAFTAKRYFIELSIKKPSETTELPNTGGPMNHLHRVLAGSVAFTTATTTPTAMNSKRYAAPPPATRPAPTVSLSRLIFIDTGMPAMHNHLNILKHTVTKLGDDTYHRTDAESLDPLARSYTDDDVAGLWTSFSPLATDTGGLKYSIVMILDNSPLNTKGIVVRVGHRCCGVLKIGDSVTVEMWRYRFRDALKREMLETTAAQSAGDDESAAPQGPMYMPVEKGNWVRELRLGDNYIPTAVAFMAGVAVEGAVIAFGDFFWTVKEIKSW